jgi:hypothetical protein
MENKDEFIESEEDQLIKEIRKVKRALKVQNSSSLKILKNNEDTMYLFLGAAISLMFLIIGIEPKYFKWFAIFGILSMLSGLMIILGCRKISDRLGNNQSLLEKFDKLGPSYVAFVDRKWKKQMKLARPDKELLNGKYLEGMGYVVLYIDVLYVIIMMLVAITTI